MEKETLVEIVFLSIVFGILVFIGPGEVLQHNLVHDKPVHFGAGDGYLYSKLTGYAYDAGHFNTLPPYSAARYNDSIQYHPPLFPVVAAGFAHTSGITPIDAVSLLMALFAIFGALITYWLIRGWNKKVAYLSAGLFVFLYISRFIIGYVWGQVLFYMGTFFLIALLFIMSKTELKYWWVPAGILIAGSINSHTSETIFFYGFAIFLIAMKFLFKQLSKKDLVWWVKQLVLATVFASIISINFLLIFYNGYYEPGAQVTLQEPMKPEEFQALRVPPVYDFTKPVFYILLAGTAISILLARKNASTALLAAGYMFLVGMTNYLGLSGFMYRAFQTRFIWPIYLAVFFGIPLYFILKKFTKKTFIFAAIGIVITIFFVNQYYQPTHPEIIYDEQWEGINWLYKNAHKTSRVLFLHGDGYDQWVRLVKLDSNLIDRQDMINVANEGFKRRMMMIEPFIVNDMHLMYRKSFFEFGYHAIEDNVLIDPGIFDLCNFEYYVVDKRSRVPQLAQVNVLFANKFLEHNMSAVFQNEHLVILKNSKPGGECIA